MPGLTGTRVFGWGYDSADRLSSITYPTFPNGIVQTISYGYDAARLPDVFSAEGPFRISFKRPPIP